MQGRAAGTEAGRGRLAHRRPISAPSSVCYAQGLGTNPGRLAWGIRRQRNPASAAEGPQPLPRAWNLPPGLVLLPWESRPLTLDTEEREKIRDPEPGPPPSLAPRLCPSHSESPGQGRCGRNGVSRRLSGEMRPPPQTFVRSQSRRQTLSSRDKRGHMWVPTKRLRVGAGEPRDVRAAEKGETGGGPGATGGPRNLGLPPGRCCHLVWEPDPEL